MRNVFTNISRLTAKCSDSQFAKMILQYYDRMAVALKDDVISVD